MSAWRRYENEPDALYTILALLVREIARGVIDPEWCEREWSEIDHHLANMVAR